MEQTFQALGGILLKAIPTALLFLFLYFYFKVMLFGPLQKVLKQRDYLTAGARKAAEDSLTLATQKAVEFEAKLRDARAEVYKEQEVTRKNWLDNQVAQVAAARTASDTALQQARGVIASEAVEARTNLQETASVLADSIATAVLQGRASR